MRLRSTLAGTAVLATLLGVGMAPAGPMITAAHAQAAISINVFYDDLAQYGEWVSYEDRYVFVPADVRAGWRPYTLGHWVNTDRFGWTWVSDEPFGWATYHYGRWGYADEIGWYWVPGTVWAPAWVSWKRTPEYVVWAPLPVTRGYDYDDADIRVNVSVGDIPDRYWVAVPAPRFLEVNLNVVVIKDRDRRERIVREAEFVGPVRVENNIVVNNVINVSFIQEKTGRDVKTVEVRETSDPREAKSSDDAVVAVKERLPRERDAKPGKVSKLEDVKQKQEKRKKAGGDQAEEPGSAAVDQGDAGPGGQTSEQGGTASDQGATAGTDEGATGTTTNRKKKQAVEQPGSEGTTGGTAATEGGNAEPDKSTSSTGSTVGAQDQAEQGQAVDQPQGQKAEGTQGVIDEQDQSVNGKAADGNGKKVKPKKQKTDQQPEGTQGAVDQGDASQQQGQKAERKKQPKSEQPEGTQGVIDQGDQGQQQSQKVKRKKAQQKGSADGPQSQGQGGQNGQAKGGQSASEEVQP
ncbi:MAG: DUF6600 domain-containing protein [Hyphomicrobiaceae bacterium]